MNEILLNILSVVTTAVVLPLISWAGVRLVAWLNTKIKDENAKQQLTKATEIVTRAVSSVFQTYVESLKASGGFDTEKQKVALIKAKNTALSQMSEDVKTYINTTYGNLENWLEAQIESTIYALKKKPIEE